MFPDAVLILGGDFNSPEIDWSSGCLTESYLPAAFRESLILLSQDFLLEQIVTDPTREESILDLCFISHPSYVCQSRTVSGLSDHNAVIVDLLNCIPCNSKPRKKMYCFKRTDWASLRDKVSSISADYLRLNETNSRSVEENWNYIRGNLLQAVDTYIPMKYISSQKNFHG